MNDPLLVLFSSVGELVYIPILILQLTLYTIAGFVGRLFGIYLPPPI